MPIHIFKNSEGFEVWTDCEQDSKKDGRILGLGKTRDAAIAEAEQEILKDLGQLIPHAPATIEEGK